MDMVLIEEKKLYNLDFNIIIRKFRNFTRITHFRFFAAERMYFTAVLLNTDPDV